MSAPSLAKWWRIFLRFVSPVLKPSSTFPMAAISSAPIALCLIPEVGKEAVTRKTFSKNAKIWSIMDNLETHLENIKKFGLPVIVAINHFETDTPKEIAFIENWCEEHHYEYSFLDGFLKGGDGSVDLAKKVQAILQNIPSNYHPLYDLKLPLKSKIETICKEIYRAGQVVYEPKALEQLSIYEKMGFSDAYICMGFIF